MHGSGVRFPESRRDKIWRRLAAIQARMGELRARSFAGLDQAPPGERVASAQRHVAASRAAAERAVAASADAFGMAAEAHERAALGHERAAAGGSGDTGEHEGQAATHRAAAVAGAREAERARSLPGKEDADDIGGPRDGTVIAAPDSGLVEVPIGGLTHRYILTSATRERDGKTHRVFTYDGEIRNAQAQPDVQAPDGHLGSGT